MIDADRREFSELLTATMQVYGTQLGAGALSIWWGALSGYPLSDVRAGLSAHVTDKERGRFAPKPADVIAQLTASDGRPGPDEAWPQCPFTEAQTVVWSDEMRAAWSVAQPLLEAGDPIAARMSFKDAYTREVAAARRAGVPVRWEVSLGHHVAAREEPIRRALDLGRITEAQALALVPLAPVQQFSLPAPIPARAEALSEAIRETAEAMRRRAREKERERGNLPSYGEEYWKARQQPKEEPAP